MSELILDSLGIRNITIRNNALHDLILIELIVPKFFPHQLMHFLIQICIGLLSCIKNT